MYTEPLLVTVQGDGALMRVLLERRHDRALIYVLLTGQQAARDDPRARQLTIFPLHADGGRRFPRAARRRVRVDRVAVPVRKPAVVVAQCRRPGVRLARLEKELRRREDLVLLAEEVDPTAADEPQAVARGLHGLERRRESPGEAQHRFAGLADRRRLQRVRTE